MTDLPGPFAPLHPQPLHTRKFPASYAAILELLGLSALSPTDQVPTIGNGILRLGYDQGRFLVVMPGATMPMAAVALGPQEGRADVEEAHLPGWPPGQALVVSHRDGSQSRAELVPGLPFALFRTTFPAASAPVVLERVEIAQVRLNLGLDSSHLCVLGTGGLAQLDSCPGSYAWMAIAHPHTRTGAVAAWLTNERASGVLLVDSDEDGRAVRLRARSDYGHTTQAAGRTDQSEIFALGHFSDVRLGLEAWADAIATHQGIVLPDAPTGYCTWYDDVHGRAGDQGSLRELAACAATNLADYGFQVVQIDDEWQRGLPSNGPKKDFTGHDPTGPYPDGMASAASALRVHGFSAGLWLLPFGGTWDDPFFASHQDWFVTRADGTPYVTPWGGTSLDMTHPGAREHVRREIAQMVHEWGFAYLKLDGLYTGIAVAHTYVNDGWKEDGFGDARLRDASVSNIAAFRSGLVTIRSAAGREAFILGCCIPQNMRCYAAAFGLVDAMRIGPDTAGDWASWVRYSPDFGARHYFLNGRVWWNDPDPVYVRSSLPLEQARCIASWTAIAGGAFVSSDWLPGLPKERLELLRRCMPAHGQCARPVDLFTAQPPRAWTLTDRQSGALRHVVGLFNWSGQDVALRFSDVDLGLEPGSAYALFDFWADAFLPTMRAGLMAELPATSCRILAIHPLVGHPFVLSTSRHICQGMIDLSQEQWDAERLTLSGTSEVVGGDAYELRIVAGGAASNRPYRVVSGHGSAASGEVTVHYNDEGERVRVVIATPNSTSVRWVVQFAPSPLAENPSLPL